MDLEVLFQNEYIVAINKPHGLLVHPSKIAKDVTITALGLLQDQLGTKLYLPHRLDRKTSGVLIFCYTAEMQTALMYAFAERQIKKKYHAIVRGYTEAEETINYALTNDDGKTQEAITHYKTLQHCEIDEAFGKFKTSRYSLVECAPQTGRMHQIRKHMAHIFHPIIGDRPHGCNKQNKLWKERWNMTKMMLHASNIQLPKIDGIMEEVSIDASISGTMKTVFEFLNVDESLLECTNNIEQ